MEATMQVASGDRVETDPVSDIRHVQFRVDLISVADLFSGRINPLSLVPSNVTDVTHRISD
jgi:hypothetical protein